MDNHDRILLNAICQKNDLAFKSFYDKYSKTLFRQINSRISDIHHAEDLFQEFWLFIWKSAELIRIDEEGKALKSLQYILSRRILDYYRNAAKRLIKVTEEQTMATSESMYYSHVFEEVIEKEIYELIDQLVEKLPELDRLIYHCRIKQQLSIKETALRLSIKEKTIQNHMTKINAQLRSLLTFMALLFASSKSSEIISIIEKTLDSF